VWRGYIPTIPAGWNGSIRSVNDILERGNDGIQLWPQAENRIKAFTSCRLHQAIK